MAFIATLAPVFQAIGAVVGVISALSQGRNQEQASQYNAAQAQENALISEQNAALSRSDALVHADQVKRENYLRLGAIAAAQGKSGGAAGEGSVLDVLGDVAGQGELERQDILYRGELQARGYQNQARGYERTAALDVSQGRNAVTSSYYKAGSELLSGASAIGSTYSKLRRV